MIPTQSEIQSTCRKATRGAGLSWGIADEAGRACAWLWEHGLDSPDALSELLQAHTDKTCTAQSCPLHLGAQICDEGVNATVTLSEVHSPLLLVSFLAELAKVNQQAYRLSFGTARYYADVSGMYCERSDTVRVSDVVIQPTDIKGKRIEKVARRSVNPTVWKALGSFEHRTYAPATEASRLAGAGAGLSDND